MFLCGNLLYEVYRVFNYLININKGLILVVNSIIKCMDYSTLRLL